MEGNSGRKHSLSDSKTSQSLAKKPRTSRDNQNNADTLALQIEYQDNVNTLKNHLESELNPELKNLVKLGESLDKNYQILTKDQVGKIPKNIHDSYKKRLGNIDDLQMKVSTTRNKAEELQKSGVATIKYVENLIKNSENLVNKIKKEKKQVEKTADDVQKRINLQGRQNMTKVKRKTIKGNEYQRILQVLIRKRALLHAGAEVGIEVSGVGQLDDVVYSKTTENKCRFFQIKHKSEKYESPVDAKELFKYIFDDDDKSNKRSSQGDEKKKNKEQPGLHLLMYFESFCNIKETSKFANCHIEEVTLITNRAIDILQRKGNELISWLVEKINFTEEDECLGFEGLKNAKKYGLNVRKAKDEFFNKLLEESKKYLSKKINDAEKITEEFLEKIHIVVNYPDLPKLRKLIFDEVFSEDIFNSLNTKILESFMIYTEIKLLQLNNEFTTNEQWQSEINEIKKFINGLKSFGITDLNTQSALSSMDFNIEFEQEIDIFVDVKNLLKDQSDHYVLECVGKNYKMNIIKILHILLRSDFKKLKKLKLLVCEYDSLLTADFLQKAFVDGGENGLLVVFCKSNIYKEESLSSNLGNQLNNTKKMIIISEGENTFTSSMKDLLKEKYLRKQYEHGYRCLTPSCKEKLRNKQICFQLQTISLGQLISDDHFANNTVDDNCLHDIVDKCKTTVTVSDDSSFCSPGYSKDYYIPRKFYQNTISLDKLKTYMLKDIFFVAGKKEMTESKVKSFLIGKGIYENFIQKWAEKKDCDIGIILCNHNTLSNSQVFDIIPSPSKNVHWISMDEHNNLFLIDSTEEHFAEDKLKDKKVFLKETHDLGRIVILVGDSGVGKSTTLTSVANIIREHSPSTWVARVILGKTFLLRILESTKNLNTADDAITCICRMIFTSETHNLFDQNLVKEGLKHCYKGVFRFVLLLDGFNEINKVLQGKIITLTKILRDYCNIDQIWITTQNHERVKLETELEVSSYFLMPLNDEDQVSLMARYWYSKEKKKNPSIKTEYKQYCQILRSDARVAIQQFKSSVNDVERRLFTANSLNLRMLADILLQQDRKIHEKLNIYDLYEKFVQQKFSLHKNVTRYDHQAVVDQREDRHSSTDSIKDQLFENCVRNVLQEFSVKTILNNCKAFKKLEDKLPEMDAYKRFKNHITSSESESILSKLGILTLKNHEFDFIHPSFAQFFFCEYLIKHLSTCDSNLKKLWVHLILSTSFFQPCRRFLDHALCRLGDSKSKNLEGNHVTKEKRTLTSTLTNILIQKKRNSAAPIKENLYYVTLFLLKWLKERDLEKYFRKILEQDFNMGNNIDTVISHFHTILKEEMVRQLIWLYQNMNKKEEIQSFVDNLIIKSEIETNRELEYSDDDLNTDCD